MGNSVFKELPGDIRFIYNPGSQDLRKMSLEMPNAKETKYGNINVMTRVHSRSAPSTFIVSDEPSNVGGQAIPREEADKMAAIQNEYMRNKEMIVIDGYIGNDPDFRVKARLIIEKENANIAAMQKILYFPLEKYENEAYVPEITVIYTPNLIAESYPDDRLIAVDLDNYVTRVFNSDYFGESKKSGLRMWNKMVYDRGGLALHAGCKIIPTKEKDKTFLIIGLSGTGKTTTTFTSQNNSRPVQDDFVALMKDGKVYASEAGSFAKTFGLSVETEKEIYNATISRNAYLENVSMNDKGELDFFDTTFTRNGRSVFPFSVIQNAGKAEEIEKADALIILNRNENIIPAVARLNREQAAAYFMLGETTGTSAGGKSEEGKALRIPGTNPFFPLPDGLQGNRIDDLLNQIDMDVFLMNTGRIGGTEENPVSKKVKIRHSSAIVRGIADNSISWCRDEDFDYMIAENIEGIDAEDIDLLNPKLLYEKTDRAEEYDSRVRSLKIERSEFLKLFPTLKESIKNLFD